VDAQKQHRPAHNDPAGLRECRVTALRDLVEKSVYDVPSEDVAASIMRDAIVIVAPSPPPLPPSGPSRSLPPEH
jgi:hypothetical protein